MIVEYLFESVEGLDFDQSAVGIIIIPVKVVLLYFLDEVRSIYGSIEL